VAVSASPTRPDEAFFVRDLAAAGVRYVMTGSSAASHYVAIDAPADFDMTPECSADNLARLASCLARWGARPVSRPDWKRTLSPEAAAAWRPFPAEEAQLDHQMSTPHGLFDVVPRVAGSFEHLMRRARVMSLFGVDVFIAHPDDLLATLRADVLEKHRMRAAALAGLAARNDPGARSEPAGPEVPTPGDR
jgi:hypothetical protein